MKAKTAPRGSRPPTTHETETLTMIAAQAALSFDLAIAQRPFDDAPIKALDSLLKVELELEATAKKALARLAVAPRRESGQAQSASPRRAQHKSTTGDIRSKLSAAARHGVATLASEDLVQLRAYCIRVSIWARTPRSTSRSRLR
jgi:hypothetical protein